MQISHLNHGDRIEIEGITRTVKHVTLHPAGTVVIFESMTGQPRILSANYIESAGWTLKARQLREVA